VAGHPSVAKGVAKDRRSGVAKKNFEVFFFKKKGLALGVANPPPRVRPPPWPSGVDRPPPRAKKMGLALGGGRSTPMDQGVASATPSFLFFF
jgi:hypothetical protein